MTLFAAESYIRELQDALRPLPEPALAAKAERYTAYTAAGLVPLAPTMAALAESDRCALVAECARRMVKAAGGDLRPPRHCERSESIQSHPAIAAERT